MKAAELFGPRLHPYYIYSPGYVEGSSGIRVLHQLCDFLNRNGCESYMVTNKTNPAWWTPRLTDEFMRQHYEQRRKPLVLYPEVVFGAPLGMGRKIRYLLNRPGFIDGPKRFDDDEFVVAFRSEFVPESGARTILTVPPTDIGLFNPLGVIPESRKGIYCYHNRFLHRGGRLQPVTRDTTEISPRHPRTLAELAAVFRSAELLYAYEASTIVTEARLCGCPVVYLPNDAMLKDHPGSAYGLDGLAWGANAAEIARAKATVDKVYTRYLAQLSDFVDELDTFIAQTQAWAAQASFEQCYPLPFVRERGWPVLGEAHAYRQVFGVTSIATSRPLPLPLPDAAAAAVSLGVLIDASGLADPSEALSRTRRSLECQTLAATQVFTDVGQALMEGHADGWTWLACAGDVFEPHALAHLVSSIGATDDSASLIYADHDELLDGERCHNPQFKPAFNAGLLLSYPYMGRALCVRNRLLRAVTAENSALVGLPLAYALALEAARAGGAQACRHIASILAHLNPEVSPVFALDSALWQRLAGVLQSHLDHHDAGALVREGPGPGTFNVIFPLSDEPPVGLMLHVGDDPLRLTQRLENLLEGTRYRNCVVALVADAQVSAAVGAVLDQLDALGDARIRVIRTPDSVLGADAGHAVLQAMECAYFVWLGDGLQTCHPDWLGHLVRQAQQPGVAVVGPRRLTHDGKLAGAGLILGLRGLVGAPFQGAALSEPGYLYRAQVAQDLSAVPMEGALVARYAIQSHAPGCGLAWNAAAWLAFCLRLADAGQRVVWAPLSVLLETTGVDTAFTLSQKADSAMGREEEAVLLRQWPKRFASDPAYNCHLSLAESGYEVETNALLRHDPDMPGDTPRVIAFAADPYGCGHYRILQPMAAMLQAGHCEGGASPELLKAHLALRSGAQTLVFQRPNSDANQDVLESLLVLPGVRKIYEVDDDLTRLPIKSVHRQTMPADIRRRMMKSIGLCDRLVVSTEPLARQFEHANGDVRVVPNRLPPAMWGQEAPRRACPPREGRKPVVGWAGGIGHRGDLELIAQVVIDTADRIDWVFFGMCPEVMRPYIKEVHGGVPTLEYPARLMALASGWDLAVAPLEVNAFNECKSNLRLLEYGWCGLPVVCSDVVPYQGGLPVTRVKNRYKDWLSAILQRVEDVEGARLQGALLQEKVRDDWVLKGEHVRAWFDAWTG
jgi:hypothetical protein